MRELPKERLDSIVSLVTDKTSGHKDPTKPYLGLEHLPSRGSSVLGMSSADDSVSINNKFRAGDLLFGKLRPRLQKSVRVEFDGYCSTDILVLRAIGETHPPFAGFLLQSDAVFSEAIRTEEGTRMPRCSWAMLRKLRVFAPENGLQRSIAEVLTTVDEAIAQTEALIAKEQQIKAGLMHDLFTRGVTPDGQLRPPREEAPKLYKDSPLGWIPKEWDCATFQQLLSAGIFADIQDGNHGEIHPKREDFVPEGIPFLMAKDLSGGEIDFERCYRITVRQYRGLRIGFATEGDVLLSHKGTIGETAIIPAGHRDVMLTPQITYYRVVPLARLSARFFLSWMRSMPFQRRMKSLAAQSTRDYVGITAQKQLLSVPLPVESEQELIASVAETIQSKLRHEASQIAKLRAIKLGLMQDLLTGRVRVPDVDAERVVAPSV